MTYKEHIAILTSASKHHQADLRVVSAGTLQTVLCLAGWWLILFDEVPPDVICPLLLNCFYGIVGLGQSSRIWLVAGLDLRLVIGRDDHLDQ